MKRKTIAAAFIAALILISVAATAQQPADITGVWNGEITLPGTPLGISIEFTKATDGLFQGKIDIPLQGAKGLPLANIVVSGGDVNFDLVGVPGEPKFAGKLTDSGQTIAGSFTQSGQTFPFAIARQSAEQSAAKAAEMQDRVAKIRAVADSLRKVWNVPGIGVGIIMDDQVVLADGFGMRDVKDGRPVTAQTIFAIGSSTKAFTTAALGMLVDDGKLDWDTPVKTYLPTFKMWDDFATQRMTAVDLTTHRSGLPRHDFMWYNSSFTRKDIFDRLQYLEPNKDFRTTWQYQNLMFMTAGYLLEQITGDTWENFVRHRIFEPLGMKSSNFSVDESQQAPDFALPYREEKDVVRQIPFRNITTAGPAGSINSDVNDMLKWLQSHLDTGKVGEQQLLKQSTMNYLHAPHMFMPQSEKYNEILNVNYALGWFTEVYRGHQEVQHGGNIDGFSTQVTLLPEDHVGIVVLSNLDGTPLPGIVSHYIADVMLGLEPVDWNGRILPQVEQAKTLQKEAEKDLRDRVPNTKPSHPLADFVGDYENPGYGVMNVKLNGKALEATYNQIAVPLEHWHYDVFLATSEDLGSLRLLLNFATDNAGDINSVSAPLEPSVKEIVFTRIPPANLSDPSFIKRLAGEYELEGQIATVSIKGDSSLTLYVPGQPVYDLVPYRKTEYTIKGLTGFSMSFTIDKSGAVAEAVFHQPNGIFLAKRKM